MTDVIDAQFDQYYTKAIYDYIISHIDAHSLHTFHNYNKVIYDYIISHVMLISHIVHSSIEIYTSNFMTKHLCEKYVLNLYDPFA